jgi:hypothetical protein
MPTITPANAIRAADSLTDTIFFKKCQEVDTVSNFVFLGVPNSISEEPVNDNVDEVLRKLEDELIQDD